MRHVWRDLTVGAEDNRIIYIHKTRLNAFCRAGCATDIQIVEMDWMKKIAFVPRRNSNVVIANLVEVAVWRIPNILLHT